MKRVLILTLILASLLCGCVSQPDPTTEPSTVPTTEPATAPTTEPATEPNTAPTTEPTTAPTTEPPVVLYRSPLSGEPMDAPLVMRPYAVVINNIRAAQPLHGIGEAEMLFEIIAEGGGSITRCLALYDDPAGLPKIGSVRSARTYLINLAQAYDAIFVHAGWSNYAQDLLRSTHWPYLNGLYGDAGAYYYRDRDRINAGYALEHTYFTTGDGIIKYAKTKNIRTDVKYDSYGLTFAPDATPNGENANTITLSFYKNGKRTRMVYDSNDGCYYGTQLWQVSTADFADANTGKKVPYENVVILYARTTTDGYRMFADLVGSGKGYFASGGKIVPILWKRSNDTSPFTYTLEDGTPITLGYGKTYVGIIPRGSPVEFE